MQDWSKEPLFRGGYTYPSPGAHGMRAKMATPLRESLVEIQIKTHLFIAHTCSREIFLCSLTSDVPHSHSQTNRSKSCTHFVWKAFANILKRQTLPWRFFLNRIACFLRGRGNEYRYISLLSFASSIAITNVHPLRLRISHRIMCFRIASCAFVSQQALLQTSRVCTICLVSDINLLLFLCCSQTVFREISGAQGSILASMARWRQGQKRARQSSHHWRILQGQRSYDRMAHLWTLQHCAEAESSVIQEYLNESVRGVQRTWWKDLKQEYWTQCRVAERGVWQTGCGDPVLGNIRARCQHFWRKASIWNLFRYIIFKRVEVDAERFLLSSGIFSMSFWKEACQRILKWSLWKEILPWGFVMRFSSIDCSQTFCNAGSNKDFLEQKLHREVLKKGSTKDCKGMGFLACTQVKTSNHCIRACPWRKSIWNFHYSAFMCETHGPHWRHMFTLAHTPQSPGQVT